MSIYWNFFPCCTDFLLGLGLLLGTAAVIVHPVIPDLTVGTGPLTPDLTVDSGPVNPDSTVGTGQVNPDSMVGTGPVSIDVTAGPVIPDNLAVNFCTAASHQWLGIGCLCKSAAIVGAVVSLHLAWLFGTDQIAGTVRQLLGTAVKVPGTVQDLTGTHELHHTARFEHYSYCS